MAPALTTKVVSKSLALEAEESTVTAPSSAGNSPAAIYSSQDEVNTLPAKFLAPAVIPFNHMDVRGRGWSTQGTTLATVVMATGASTQTASDPSNTITNPNTPASDYTLPVIPTWVEHAVVGCATFMLVVAVVLFLAQFPPNLTWAKKLQRWKRPGYTKLGQEDEGEDLDDWPYRASSSAVASSRGATGSGGRTGALRKRKPGNLSIDTGARYRGLGIAMPGDQETTSARRSFDEEDLRAPPVSPARTTWESFTAPLPSVTNFVNGRGTGDRSPNTTHSNIEAGQKHSLTASVSTPDMFDINSPYHASTKGGAAEATKSAFLERVNEGVYYAADCLSRTFYDPVTEPEEGLLLPVHNHEREPALTSGVMVE